MSKASRRRRNAVHLGEDKPKARADGKRGVPYKTQRSIAGGSRWLTKGSTLPLLPSEGGESK